MMPKTPRFLGLSVLTLGILALLYQLTLGWFLPRYLQSHLPGLVQDKLHLQLRLRHLAIHPWSLRVQIDDLDLQQQGASLLEFRQLSLRPKLWASLWQRAPVIDRIVLVQPKIHLRIDAQGRVNLLALSLPASPPSKTPAASSSMAWRIDHLDLVQGSVSLADARIQPTLHSLFSPIDLHLHDLGTLPHSPGSHLLYLATSDGATLTWQGRVHLAPLAIRGHLRVQGLDLPFWARLSPQALPVKLMQGRLGLQGDIDLPAGSRLPDITHGQLDVAQLQVQDTRGHPLLTLPSARLADFSLQPAQHQIHIASLILQGGQLKLLRDAHGRLQALPVASKAPAAVATTAPPPSAEPPAAAWNWQLGLFAWRQGSVDLTDRSLPLQTSLHDIDFELQGLNQDPAQALNLQLHTGLGQGSIAVQGSVQRQPLQSDLQLQFNRVDIRPVQGLLARRTWLRLDQGLVSGQGQLHVAGGASTAVNFHGGMKVDHLSLQDVRDHQPLLSWNQVSLPQIDFATRPAHLLIPKVIIADPYARIMIDRQRVANVATLLRTPNVSAHPAQAQHLAQNSHHPHHHDQAPWPVRISEVDIHNGAIAFSDLSLGTPFAAGINDLNGPIRHLDSNASRRASVDLQGLVNHYGHVSIAGQINPLAQNIFLDMGLHFSNVELSTLTPYSAEFAGYRINQGKLDMNLHYHIDHRQLQAENQVQLDQMRLGERVDSPEAVHLPLKLALALLRDADGNINIDLPISGSLDNPDFQYGKLLWKAVLNLLEKAVTSPFRLLSSLIHAPDPDALKHVDFLPGSANVDASQQQKLVQLGQALAQRPSLILRILPMTADQADTYGLQTQAFSAEFAQRRAQSRDDIKVLTTWLGELAGSAQVAILKQLSMVPDPASTATQPRLILNQADYRQRLQTRITQLLPLGPGALRELALARAAAIKAILIGQAHVADQRLYLVDPGHTQVSAADHIASRLKIDAL